MHKGDRYLPKIMLPLNRIFTSKITSRNVLMAHAAKGFAGLTLPFTYFYAYKRRDVYSTSSTLKGEACETVEAGSAGKKEPLFIPFHFYEPETHHRPL